MKKRTEIMYYVLMVLCVAFIVVVIIQLTQPCAKSQYPGVIHDTEIRPPVERNPIK